MEILLNIAWGLCSLGLISFWWRTRDVNPESPRMQLLALSMVILLLLPVISLSDDLMAMQGPAEADSSLRRVLHSDEGHPSIVPTSFTLAEQVIAALPLSEYVQVAVQVKTLAIPATFLTRSLDRRPPPQA